MPDRHDVWALIGDATRELERAGVPSPRFDAEELAGWALDVPRARLRGTAAGGDKVDNKVDNRLDDEAVARFRAGVERRARREPLQHIVGRAAFRYVDVAVGPGVFVPRPETEVVAGWAIDRAREVVAAGRVPRVVDLCAGSGVIALAVADEVPGAQVHAVELSPDALAWARRNLEGSTVQLHPGDAADALPELDGAVDVVVGNPPYIPDGAIVRDAEVLDHDPPLALWGHGPDGLDVMRVVLATASRLLRDGGWVVVEHADLQGGSVPELLRDQGGWTQVADHRDLAGRDRFATGRRSRAATRGRT